MFDVAAGMLAHIVIVVANPSSPNVDFAAYDLEVDRVNGGLVVNGELQARTGIYVVRTTVALRLKPERTNEIALFAAFNAPSVN